MTKRENSHLLWPSRILKECSTQNPKIEVLNPVDGTGKEKIVKKVNIHIGCCLVTQW
jgi:hypothetical protein